MKNKLIAVAMLIVLICLGLVWPSLSDQGSDPIIAVSATEAADLIDKHRGDDQFTILDIRTPGEYQSGHLANSIPIDFYSPTFADQLEGLDKTKTYLVYCRTGNRSTKSLALFKKLKFQNVYHLASGISAWQSEGFAVVK